MSVEINLIFNNFCLLRGGFSVITFMRTCNTYLSHFAIICAGSVDTTAIEHLS